MSSKKMPDAHRKMALSLLMLVVGMVMLTFASVPLYDLFCRVTGFDGTPKRAIQGVDRVLDREIVVRFNSDRADDLPWDFAAEVGQVRVRLGEQRVVNFYAENKSNEPITGRAIYNVVPEMAAAYFNKIQCFCFENQTLQPGERVIMPVMFFMDPALADNPTFNHLQTVTLSYTFFLSK